MLEAGSFSDLLDQLEFLNDIGAQDERIASEVKVAKLQMQETRNATRKTRKQVAATTRTVAARTAEQRAVRDRLAWSQRELATARRDKRATLATVQENKQDALEHMRSLQAQSAELGARIRSAQSSSIVPGPTGAASAAGFVWPVHGVLTSALRLALGTDARGHRPRRRRSGTPVVAAAAGTVIVAGWLGGYGNLVVVDHGNGISTAYGHNTSVAVGVGQSVAQGQLVAYSGNTGHSTGPHVHFEVRINGSPVDPLGYSVATAGRRARRPVAAVRVAGEVNRQLLARDDVQVGQRAPALVEPEPVAGEELVRDGEPDVAERHVVHEPPVGPVEQRHRGEARRARAARACGPGSSGSGRCRRRPRRRGRDGRRPTCRGPSAAGPRRRARPSSAASSRKSTPCGIGSARERSARKTVLDLSGATSSGSRPA